MKYKEANFDRWDSMPDEETFSDWVAMRKAKRAATTQTALNRAAKYINMFSRMGYDANLVLAIACEKGWQGLEYVYENERKNGFPDAPRSMCVPNISQARQTREVSIREQLTDRNWANDLWVDEH